MDIKPIGIVHSPFKQKEDINPDRNLKPDGYDDVHGQIEIFPEFQEGLQDIDGFSHLIVICAFFRSEEGKLFAHPPFDNKKRGVFSTRSPYRPNPIGLTVVRLLGREGNILKISGIDMMENTLILDIKPYTPRDLKSDAKFGWLEAFLPKSDKIDI